MKIFFCPEQLAHRPAQFMIAGRMVPSLESPARCERVVEALMRASYKVEQPRRDFPFEAIARVHAAGYLEFLRGGFERWTALANAGPEIVPNVHPYRGSGDDFTPRKGPRAASPIAQAGHYLGDLACSIGPHTWRSAIAATHTALAAAESVLAGEHAGLRGLPPAWAPRGHADRAAGFCYLNNVAIAAEFMLQHFKRVAILDVDTHHGDGTQSIFYRRGEVQFVSIHVDPTNYYHFTPAMPTSTAPARARARTSTSRSSPRAATPISSTRSTMRSRRSARTVPRRCSSRSGFDAHERDPLSVLKVTNDGYRRIGGAVAGLKLPTVLVQEGGYNLDLLGANVVAFIGGFNLASRM